jgi:flagellin
MSLNISTNTAALKAGSYLAQNSLKLQKAYDRLASGKKLSSPMDNPGGLAVSMKLQASINRLSGAANNVQNALSFLEVQDGMLESVGNIVDRMSELKGLASQDPMKSDQDRASYNNEFKDLQTQLYDISQMKFNGVSLFANTVNVTGGDSTVFGGSSQSDSLDNTLTIYTSESGAAGSKVSVHKSVLQSALTIHTNTKDSAAFNTASNVTGDADETTEFNATFAVKAASGAEYLDLADISVGVITQALENISFLRSQNGGVQSRLTFNLNSISTQKTNMRAALGRVVDLTQWSS